MRAADGPVAVFNFDAHGDNGAREIAEDDPRMPTWGGTWVWRMLGLRGIDPTRYLHFGMRGPRNSPASIANFIGRGVLREHIYTYTDIVRARRADFEGWVAQVVAPALDGAAKAWIIVDPDVLDMSPNPDFGDEPLGMYPEELCWAAYQIGRLAGRGRLGGVGFTALPFDAMTLHWIMMYTLIYALAGVVQSEA